MTWNVELTDEVVAWVHALGRKDRASIASCIDALEIEGPALGRPLADSIKDSRHHNMKELRSVGGHLRTLFCFDPRRTAIVLLGGDKTNDWAAWYERNIPVADDLYDVYLDEIRKEGLI